MYIIVIMTCFLVLVGRAQGERAAPGGHGKTRFDKQCEFTTNNMFAGFTKIQFLGLVLATHIVDGLMLSNTRMQLKLMFLKCQPLHN